MDTSIRSGPGLDSLARVRDPRPCLAGAGPRARAMCLASVLLCGAASSQQLDWSLRLPATLPAQENGRLAYDSGRQRLVLQQSNNETWEWDGADWWRRGALPGALRRFEFAMAYDEQRREVILFGGWTSNSNNRLRDTWAWDGNSWTQRNPATPPFAMAGHTMAYDPVRQRVVLIAGHSTSPPYTFTWDGTNWTQLPLTVLPPARLNAAAVFDAARGNVLLFGGLGANYLSDTWAFDGAQWTRLATGGPTGRRSHAMSYDPRRGAVILFGGFGYRGSARVELDDTWEWNGTAWSQVVPTLRPTARVDHAMAFDAARDDLILFGGTSSAFTTNDTWQFGPTTPPSFNFGGQGCPGTAGYPTLRLATQQLPWVGETVGLRVAAIPATTAVAILNGQSGTTWNGLGLPFDLASQGMPGCTLRVSIDIVAPLLTSSGGVATFDLSIPANRTLVGRTLYQQALILDPPVNAAGLTLSHSLLLQFGAR